MVVVGVGCSLAIALLLAVLIQGVIRGTGMYKTLLIWPFAVAPVVAGMLWVFRFSSPIGVIAFALQSVEIQRNHLRNSNHAMTQLWLQRFGEQIS